MGVEPLDYMVFEVDATSLFPEEAVATSASTSHQTSVLSNESGLNGSFSEAMSWSQLVLNLKTGKKYYVRVSAKSDKVGYGESAEASSNPVVPRGVPGQLGRVQISHVDAVTVLVEVEQTAETNGAEVLGYSTHWTTNPQFSGAQSEILAPNYHVQAIRLNAWQQGWTSDSDFSLSLFDFRGSFNSRLGGIDNSGLPTFVSISEGTNTLNRTTPNATAGFGEASLYKAIPRGGFVSVGGQEFRVCLDRETPYDAETLTLCSVTDPYVSENFVGAATKYDNTLTRVPAYVLDTAIGSAMKLAVGDTALRTYDGPDTNISVNDITATLARGDHLRLGHPENGRVFTICKADGTSNLGFNSTSLPLCSGDNPEEITSVMDGDIISATYEIQAFGLWLNTSAVVPNGTGIFGFRLAFGAETSAMSKAGGDPGCLSIYSSAEEVRASDMTNSCGSIICGLEYAMGL